MEAIHRQGSTEMWGVWRRREMRVQESASGRCQREGAPPVCTAVSSLSPSEEPATATSCVALRCPSMTLASGECSKAHALWREGRAPGRPFLPQQPERDGSARSSLLGSGR